MYGVYGDIISAAERALNSFSATEELLEYPEVQADKAYYLSVLSKYNDLRSIKDKLEALTAAIADQKAASALLAEALSEPDRAAIYEEISALKRKASVAATALSDALGCKHVVERAYCRFKLGEGSSKLGTALFALIKFDLSSRGAKIEDENTISRGGSVKEISFVAEGADVIARLSPLSGAHKVYSGQSRSDELCFAVTPAAVVEKVVESDLRIDLFRSSGAGGQHINKTETAIRVTHLPSGLTVVCQDERSQLQNKKRALETIEKRLKERSEQAEKKRMEADIAAQHSRKNTPITFDADGGMFTDARLKVFTDVPFPLSAEQFAAYLNGLIAL
ncbi:MAG: hypothetical protein HDT28_08885 [Clostridiales bacterium]|nr:hypothetical protein [Clostridiales bacterium]